VVKIFLGWDHSVWEGMIDAQTGKVIGKGETISEDQLDQKDDHKADPRATATIVASIRHDPISVQFWLQEIIISFPGNPPHG
jgi:hypothetical protein